MRDIVDDEQRRDRLATPMRPKGCGGAWASASLALLDNVTALPASRRLASAQAALATRHILILGHAPSQEALQLEEEVSKVMPREAREAVMNLTNPFIELGKQRGIVQGRQEGIVDGRQEGQAELVLKQIAKRLGAPSPANEKAIRKLSVEKIEALGEALLDFSAPTDLARWPRQNK
jgi:hypothetical protein